MGIDVVPVIQAIGHIAVLLNLKHDNAVAESMNRTGRQEDTVTRLWREVRKVLCDGLVSESSPQKIQAWCPV